MPKVCNRMLRHLTTQLKEQIPQYSDFFLEINHFVVMKALPECKKWKLASKVWRGVGISRI